MNSIKQQKILLEKRKLTHTNCMVFNMYKLHVWNYLYFIYGHFGIRFGICIVSGHLQKKEEKQQQHFCKLYSRWDNCLELRMLCHKNQYP